MNVRRSLRQPSAAIVIALSAVTLAAAQLPNPGMTIDPTNTALVVTDPQNDFLSPEGVTWGVVGESVTENNTVKNIETLFAVAKDHGIPVFVSRTTTIPPTTAGSSRALSKHSCTRSARSTGRAR